MEHAEAAAALGSASGGAAPTASVAEVLVALGLICLIIS